MLRRAVEIARQQHLADLVANGKQGVAAAAAAAAAGAGSSHRHSQQQQQQPQGCEVEWQEGDKPLVERSHSRQAQSEMFSALHHQLLRSRSCWEKLLLVAVVVEVRATGRSAVVIQVGWIVERRRRADNALRHSVVSPQVVRFCLCCVPAAMLCMMCLDSSVLLNRRAAQLDACLLQQKRQQELAAVVA
jgi:hypothetical protein